MAEGIFQRQAGALRETDDDQTLRPQPTVLAGFKHRLVTPLDSFIEVGLVHFARIPKAAGVPTARSLGLRNHPADPFDIAEASG